MSLLQAGQAAVPPVPFATVRRRMADYLVAGLQLTPPDSTFVEMRDAILLAADAIRPADALVMAQAFATRGLGQCAWATSMLALFLTFSRPLQALVLSHQIAFLATTLEWLNPLMPRSTALSWMPLCSLSLIFQLATHLMAWWCV